MAKKKSRATRPSAESPSRRASSSAPAPAATRVKARASYSKSDSRWFIIGVIAAMLIAGGVYLAYPELWSTRPPSEPPAAPAKPAATAPPATYVGSAVCEGCHAKETAAWRGSDHDLAMQPADARSVLGDFANGKFTHAGVTSTFFQRDGKYYVNTDGPEGKRADYEIKYTFGVRPLQQYLIEFAGGRMQALGIAWDSRAKADGGQRWFHLYPQQQLKSGDPLHWTGIQQNWNFQCAECHSTHLRKAYDASSNAFNTQWAQLNVACEACHGPGSRHAEWAKAPNAAQYQGASKGLVVALDERKGIAWTAVAATGNAQRSAPRASAREIDTCARCHARSSRFSDDEVHGRPLGDTHRLSLLDEGLYYADGQMRDEVYNWGSFVQSRMHAQGVTCSDCHDPHSLKLRAPGNAVCAQCHAPAKYDASSHTHHREGSTGAACVACHMPTTTYMGVDARHDHSLRVPRPDLSVTLGVPNACNRCHTKETPQWAADTVSKWYGHVPAGYQRFAEALAAGTSGAPGARGALANVIVDATQPAIARASALQRLGRWLTPPTVEIVVRAQNDADPLVRAAAVEALEGSDAATRTRYLPRLLADPVRGVRMAAARALAGQSEAGIPADARAAFAKALDEYVAAQKYNADRPEGWFNLGNLYVQRNDPEQAIAAYRKAIAIDPTFEAGYANLADLYRARGVDREGETMLREGLARNPQSATIQYALALALIRQKHYADALTALAAAARTDPGNPRYAYTYAVALHDQKQAAEGTTVLREALARHRYDRDLLSALASYALESGDHAAALGYAKQLRELDPDEPRYAQLVARIEGAPPK